MRYGIDIALRTRLVPYPRHTHAQKCALDFLLWQGRLLYNAALEQRIPVYQETGTGMSYRQQGAHFRDLHWKTTNLIPTQEAFEEEHRPLWGAVTALCRGCARP